MRSFWMADLSVSGELLLQERYENALLEQVPGAAELIGEFSGHFYRSPDSFELTLLDGTVRVTWGACSGTCGVASIRFQDPLSSSEGWQLASFALLLTGLNPEDDQVVCAAAQKRVVEVHRNTGFEPAFDLAGLTERPLVVSFNRTLPQAGPHREIVSLSDRCFGAAYFRWHRLT